MRHPHALTLLVLLLCGVVTVGCVFRGYLAGLLPSSAADMADITLPPGFRIAVYAADVPNARQMALGPPTFVKIEGDRAVSYETFAAGWLKGSVAAGRPADVLVMPDGSLLVSDDKAGRFYRITYAPGS